jgi:hypothetical protein
MNIPTGVSAMLQVIAALFIFVASYLAIVVCAIACLAVAELFSGRAEVIREYGATSIPAGARGLSDIGREARPSRLSFRRPLAKRI